MDGKAISEPDLAPLTWLKFWDLLYGCVVYCRVLSLMVIASTYAGNSLVRLIDPVLHLFKPVTGNAIVGGV
jgi:hypothetical protein